MSRSGIRKGRIPEAFYKKICGAVPIFCVDVIAEDAYGKFLVVRRLNHPAQGKWWLPGGRVLKNEKVSHAAARKLKEETGIRGKFKRIVGFYEFFAEKGPFRNVNVHTPIIVCLMRVGSSSSVRLESQSGEFRWVKNPFSSMHPELRAIIRRRAHRGHMRHLTLV